MLILIFVSVLSKFCFVDFLLLLICFHLVILGGGARGGSLEYGCPVGPRQRSDQSHWGSPLARAYSGVWFPVARICRGIPQPLGKDFAWNIHLSVGFPTQGHPTRLGHDVPVARSPVFQHTAWAFPFTSYVQAPILAFLHWQSYHF